jgi:hypothetical protein
VPKELALPALVLLLAAMLLCGCCNTQYDGDGGSDDGGDHYSDGGGDIIVSPADGGSGGETFPACEGGFNWIFRSDSTGLQRITYLRAGWDETQTRPLNVGRPVVMCIIPATTVYAAVELVCTGKSPCPGWNKNQPAPAFSIDTDPTTAFYFFGAWEGDSLFDLPPRGVFVSIGGVDMMPQDKNYLFATSIDDLAGPEEPTSQ